MNRINTAQAHALRKSMLEARTAFQKAHVQYQSAFELTMDTRGNPDGALAYRRACEDYAEALSAYMNASRRWLAFVDMRFQPQSRGKAPIEQTSD